VIQALPWQDRMLTWVRNHAQVLVTSAAQLAQRPMEQLPSAAVIGIALALPSALHVGLDNLDVLAGGLQGTARISLFLHANATDADARDLAARLRQNPDIAAIQVTTRAQALAELRRYAGFGQSVAILGDNPLPPVLEVQPTREDAPAAVGRLARDLEAVPEVELIQLDMKWVQRLFAIMEIGERVVLILGGLLAVAVLVVVGNTIRLDIENRRAEIEVVKLIGGTEAFIRRPFLYRGLWYGLIGGASGWVLVELGRSLLAGPVQRLAGLYDSQYTMAGLGLGGLGVLIALGAGLGLLGSWIAVGRHLRRFEPA
jgi:cell division transport system permease protein